MKHKKNEAAHPLKRSTLPGANQQQKDRARAAIFAAELAAHPPTRDDGGLAFVREADGVSPDEFATEMGRDFLIAAESGREVLEELSDEKMPEENGGPFVLTAGSTELAEGLDESNPEDASREPLPSPMRVLQ